MSTATAGGSTIQGVLLEKGEQQIVLQLPGTDYKLHLAVDAATLAKLPAPGERITGRIVGRAKRVDVVRAGGRFVDPVIGRPRRVQGRLSAIDAPHNCITVFAGLAVSAELTMNQKASDFAVGALVAFDIERGARLELA